MTTKKRRTTKRKKPKASDEKVETENTDVQGAPKGGLWAGSESPEKAEKKVSEEGEPKAEESLETDSQPKEEQSEAQSDEDDSPEVEVTVQGPLAAMFSGADQEGDEDNSPLLDMHSPSLNVEDPLKGEKKVEVLPRVTWPRFRKGKQWYSITKGKRVSVPLHVAEYLEEKGAL